MKPASKIFALSGVLLIAISASGYFLWLRPGNSLFHKRTRSLLKINLPINNESLLRLQQKATLAKDFTREYGYNTTRCFLLDMKLPSGKNRFFVYNLEKDFIEMSGLVTHGSGSDNGKAELYFSNKPNSNCTSLGRYKVGKSYNGSFGLAYKLYGLDNTNSKAFQRFVVLHSHACVPANEVDPQPICESWGCPTVAPEFLGKLKKYLDESQQPILLWIYY